MSDLVAPPSDPIGWIMKVLAALPLAQKRELYEALDKQRTRESLEELREQQEALRHRQDQYDAEHDAEIGSLRDGLRQVADASARRQQAKDRYYVRTVIGNTFSPAISAPRMGKLLQVVGILNLHGRPYHEYQKGGEPLAKMKPWSDYETWLFHIDKTKKQIDRWLTEHEYYEDFHTTATKEDRDAFIDMIYEENPPSE
ncbi:MAG TPA: hypothetical protein VM537_29040 [Anaerolineae bacterium]|nr:hypothetical protein [Anaerolineae bacterium]